MPAAKYRGRYYIPKAKQEPISDEEAAILRALRECPESRIGQLYPWDAQQGVFNTAIFCNVCVFTVCYRTNRALEKIRAALEPHIRTFARGRITGKLPK